MKKIEEFVKNNTNKIFCIMFIIFSVILLYKIGVVPKGLHVDEAGMAFDALSLISNGTDRYQNQLPVYLVNFGGGQSALYAYLTSVLVGIFGFSIAIIRIPSVIITLISLIAIYKLIKENVGNVEALLISFIYIIIPFNIMKSRWALDAYLFAPMLVISIYWLLHAINKCKYRYFVIAGIFFGLTLYTYAISYIIIPIMLFIVLIYYLYIKEINFKQILVFVIPLFLLALPLLLMVGYNSEIIPKINLPLFKIPDLWWYRGAEVSFSNISKNINEIFKIIFVKDFLDYNAIEEFGTIYYISIPFVIFGIIFTICDIINVLKRKEKSVDVIFIISFVVIFIVSLCLEEVNINKINAIYIPIVYFIAKGIWFLCNRFKKTYIIIILIYLIELIMFLNYYFGEYADKKLYLFEENIIYATEFAEELNKENIYVEQSLNQTYIYTVLASETKTQDFVETYKLDEYYRVYEYSNYKFYFPNEIDKNGVYIIKYDENLINVLKENGYKEKEFEEFKVLYLD